MIKLDVRQMYTPTLLGDRYQSKPVYKSGYSPESCSHQVVWVKLISSVFVRKKKGPNYSLSLVSKLSQRSQMLAGAWHLLFNKNLIGIGAVLTGTKPTVFSKFGLKDLQACSYLGMDDTLTKLHYVRRKPRTGHKETAWLRQDKVW